MMCFILEVYKEYTDVQNYESKYFFLVFFFMRSFFFFFFQICLKMTIQRGQYVTLWRQYTDKTLYAFTKCNNLVLHIHIREETHDKQLPQELQYISHKIILSYLYYFYLITLCKFIKRFKFYIIYPSVLKNIFVNEQSYLKTLWMYIKNSLRHSLKISLGSKPKHVAIMMFLLSFNL
jgi:hypothetical protein